MGCSERSTALALRERARRRDAKHADRQRRRHAPLKLVDERRKELLAVGHITHTHTHTVRRASVQIPCRSAAATVLKRHRTRTHTQRGKGGESTDRALLAAEHRVGAQQLARLVVRRLRSRRRVGVVRARVAASTCGTSTWNVACDLVTDRPTDQPITTDQLDESLVIVAQRRVAGRRDAVTVDERSVGRNRRSRARGGGAPVRPTLVEMLIFQVRVDARGACATRRADRDEQQQPTIILDGMMINIEYFLSNHTDLGDIFDYDS